MSTLSKTFLTVLILSLFFLLSCGSDESGPSITSVRLSVEPNAAFVEVGTSLTLYAKDQNGNDISDIVTFLVDGIETSGNNFSVTEAGTLEITAEYENLKSTIFSIDVINVVESISIEVDKESVKPSGSDFVTVTAKDQTGFEISKYVKFYVNGVLNSSGNLISTTEFGDLNIVAKYKDVESPVISVRSTLGITSLKLEVDKEIIPADSYTKASIKVFDQENDDVTKFVELMLNGEVISGANFNSGTTGVYQLKANYEGVESNVVAVQVEPFTVRKVLIEEFTGEWCGWCPEAAYNLETLVEEHPYVLTVGIHNGDGLVFNNEDIIRDAFGINGFPGGLVGRVNLNNVGYNSNPMNPAIATEYNRQIYDETVLAGVGISSQYVGSDVEIDVSINFYEDIQDEVRVTIYIIENEVTGGTQENYFSNNAGFENYYYYPKPAKMSNFVHQFVLRKAATDILGEVIPAEAVVKGSTYNLETKTVSMSNYRLDNSYIIAFIHYPLDGSKKILNAQQVKAGESIGVDK